MTAPTRRGVFERLQARLRRSLAEPVRQLQLSLALLLGLVVVGTVGYMVLAPPHLHIRVVDALYMTVITLTTVGFQEVFPLDTAGRIFTVVLVVGGVGTAAWAVRNAAEVTLNQTFWVSMQRRRMKEMVMDLRDHYVVCGYGRLGRQIVRDLRARGERFVVLDWSEGVEQELLEARIPHLIADATQEESLEQAGIAHARGL
ncbi:MAG TPA: NAD-binding protein, partial [Longimicrobiales bacterium]|nr:NAD-binding protein [Longimicrobiales bacterium]